MSEPTPAAIATFLRQQYAFWNQGKWPELLALFREMAPQDFTIEYVGTPVQDGWKAMDDIWREHGAHTRIEVIELLVNGQEAAVYALNHHKQADGSTDIRPSLETYRFANGTLQARYFYRVT